MDSVLIPYQNGKHAWDTLMDSAFDRELEIVAKEMERPPYSHPEKGANDPLKKGLALVRAGKVTRRSDGAYLVQGKEGTYTCTSECTCPQSQKGRSKWCYHLVAAFAYKEVCARVGSPEPTLPLGPSTPEEYLAQAAQIAPQSTNAPDPVPQYPELNLEAASGLSDDFTQTTQEHAMATPQTDEYIPEPETDPTPTPNTTDAIAALETWYGEPMAASYVAHDRIERSPQVGVLMAALARAQARMANPTFDSANPHFRNRYASLAAVRDAVTPALTAEGIALTQLPSSEDGWVCVTTGLWHASGQYLCSTLRLPVPKGDPQGYGSALTYARRYGLQAICNVAGDEDDDAESLRGKTVTTGQKPVTPDNPMLRQEIAKALKALGFEGTTKEQYEAEVLRRTDLPLHPANYPAILTHLKTAVDLFAQENADAASRKE
jgi:hypothetical protein